MVVFGKDVMGKRLLQLLSATFGLILIATSALANSDIPIESFIQWPSIESVSISPNGQLVAMQNNVNGDIITSFIYPKTRRFHLGHAQPKNTSDIALQWIDNHTVVILQYVHPNGRKLIKHNLKTGKSTELLLTYSEGNIKLIAPSSDGKNIYISGEKFSQEKRAKTYNSVFSIDLNTTQVTRLFHNKWGIDTWYTDKNAKKWLGYKYDNKTNYIYTFDNGADNPKIIIEQGLLKNPDFEPVAINSQSNIATMLTNVNDNTIGLHQFDMLTGKPINKMASDTNFDMSGDVLLSKDLSTVIGLHYQQQKGHSVFFDQTLEQIYQTLSTKFPDDVVQILDYSESKKQVVFKTYADVNPGEFHYYDATEDNVILLGSVLNNLPRKVLAETTPIEFTTKDQQKIHGYITLPHNTTKDSPAPLVVMPHGGPYLRDVWAYDHYLQFLASRGFAVLQVNFRSSTGYGIAHFKAGIKQYGSTPIDDILAGIDWSITNLPIDDNKICAFGASYGGFATLKLLTQAPDVFRCGVVMSGFGDLALLLEDDKDYDFYDFEVAMMGDPNTEKDIIKQNSPIHEIDKIQAPVFIIHGKRDRRVKFHHAKQIIAKLKAFNKSHETMLPRDEGHSFVKRRNQKNFYKKLNAFLSKHLK